MNRLGLLILSTGLTLGACTTDRPDVSTGSTPIINGSAATGASYGAVVSLHRLIKRGKNVYVDPNIFCSGTAITTEHVMTAAHCLSGQQADRVAIYVGNDPTVDIVDHVYSVAEISVHPNYSSGTLLNDIALARLATPITEGITPIPALPAEPSLAATPGEAIDFVGFGQTENNTYNVKLHVVGELGGFGCEHAYCPNSGDAASQIWYYQDASNNGGQIEGPCSGDSGGPALVTRSGQQYVAGITSYGDANCQYYGVSTYPPAFASYIAAFTGGGGDGGGDGGGGDGGGDGGGNSCGDGVCDDGESCDGRNGTTSCSTDCPGKTSGKPSSRWCTVGASCDGPGCP